MSHVNVSHVFAAVVDTCNSAVGPPFGVSILNRTGTPDLGDHTSIWIVVPADQSIPPSRAKDAPAHVSVGLGFVIAVTFADVFPLVSGLSITSAGPVPPNTPQV